MTICSVSECGKNAIKRGLCTAHYKRLMRHGSPTAGRTAPGVAHAFVRDVVLPFEGDECLFWPFATNDGSRGVIRVDGRSVLVSRYVCAATHGAPTRRGLEAAHSCGKGHLGCVNPRHLSWKTPSENQADKLLHGTHTRGERHPLVKLAEADVLAIRSLRGKQTQNKIAETYGVSVTTVCQIQTGTSWRWL